MTGVNYRKIRHYAPGIRTKQTRLDPDISALLFKAGVRVTSSTERLIADVSIKAAMPNASLDKGDSDGRKRGLESARSSKLVNNRGMVYDPNGKKEPGTYLKLHVTEPERKAALMSPDPVANFGWVKMGESNTPKKPKGVEVSVTRYKLDPRTGNPIKGTGHNPFDPFAQFEDKGIEVKGLGKTIGESNPGSKLVNFAARAAGVVVDALGKFRCPPGTPAANRFTNERGEGCFAVGAAAEKIVSAMALLISLPDDDESILGSVQNVMQSQDRVTLVSSLLQVGISADKIRRAYREGGIRGLASLASEYSHLGGPDHLVGEKWNDPSYRAAIAPTLREAMRLTDGRVERMARIAEEKRLNIQRLMAELGVPDSGDEETNLINLIEAIGSDPRYGLSAGGHVFYVGGTKENHQEFLRNEFYRIHFDAIAPRYPELLNSDGNLDAAKCEDKYLAEKASGIETPFTKAIDAMMERESQSKIGALEQIALDAVKSPESFKNIKITVDPSGFTNEHSLPDADGNLPGYAYTELNGMAGGDLFYIGSGAAVRGYREPPPEGAIDIYEATGGLQEQQWAAIAAAIHADETGRYWAHTYSLDLAAMMGRGWRDMGAQVAAHEGYHLDQINAISKYVKAMSDMGVPGFADMLPKDDSGNIKQLEDMTSGELLDTARSFLAGVGPEHLRSALGADIEDLIDRRLDGVAGTYSGDVQQEALQKIAAASAGLIDPKEANEARSVALLETMTELAANRSVGLIGDDPELDSFIDKVYGPPSFTPSSTPPVPGGSTAPDGPTPDTPDGAPTPSIPGADTMWWSAEDVGIVRPEPPASRTPSGGSGRGGGGRGKHDPFGKRRNSIIAKLIREGRLTPRDIAEVVYGRNKDDLGNDLRPNGLLFNLNRVLNGTQRFGRDLDSFEVQERIDARYLVKDALRSMDLNEEELGKIAEKIGRGVTLSAEEESKLVNSISQLWQKQELIKQEITQLEVIGSNARTSSQERRLRTLKRAQRELGQTFIAPINDLWDINEFYKDGGAFGREINIDGGGTWVVPSTYPDMDISPSAPEYLRDELVSPTAYLGGMASASRVSQSQDSRLSQEELLTVSRAVSNPPRSSVSSIDFPEYAESALVLDDIYESYGMVPKSTSSFDDTETVVPVLKVIDKSEVDEEIIAELEIDDFDYEVGSVIETEQIEKAEVLGKGFASSSRAAKSAGIAGRLLNSRAARKAMQKLGIDPENEDLVSLAAETAIAFSAGGPAAAIIPIARRGSRDMAENILGMMVSRGWITPEIYQKIVAHGLDKIAKEGLPDEIMKAINEIVDSVNTEENKAGALRLVGVLKDRASELSESTKSKLSGAKDSVSGVFGKSEFVEIETKVLGPGLREKPKPEKKPTGKKQKVRVVVPPGSKGKVEKSGDMLLPPGKMKVTGFDEDGVAEAEVTEQVSAVEYMKNAEKKLSESIEKTTDERVKKLLSSSAEKYKRSKRDLIISSKDSSSSGISRATLDKAQEIIDSANNMGYALFNDENVYVGGEKISVSEYYDTFIKAINSTIKEIKTDAQKELFPEDKELNKFLKINSEERIYSTLAKISGSIFGAVDRRARISMTKSSLEEFLESGRIANVDVDSKMLSQMKKNRDSIIGGSVSSSEFSLTPVELMHESETKRIEQNLFLAGTRVGSEEFADYGRGIEVVIRSENSKRIGYGRSDFDDNEGFYSLLTDDNQQRVTMTVFGNVVKGGEQAKNTILSALSAYLSKDYRSFLRDNGDNVFEGFIVGEISLNDIEHIKIPVSIFGVENKPVSKSHPIAGKKRITSLLKQKGMTEAQINDYFDKGGMIGGGSNSKYLTYLLQVEAAQELKERLISFGMAEVIFTNKSGIDIMAEETWVTPPPMNEKGINALRQLAKMEVNAAIEKAAPKDKKKVA